MIQFESGQTLPSEWQRDDYRIVETWRELIRWGENHAQSR